MEFFSLFGSLVLMVSISPCLATYIISDYRLITKDRPNAGIVEVFVQGIGWGIVCQEPWSFELASIVCHQLNFPGTSLHLVGTNFEDGDNWPSAVTNNITTYYTSCAIHEMNIQCDTCNRVCNCDQNSRIAALTCKEPGYLGCFTDPWSLQGRRGRVFSSGPYRYDDALTIDLCITLCKESGFFYAGVEYSEECFCGRQDEAYDRHGVLADGECNYVCDGDRFETCGGSDKIAVYKVDISVCRDPGNPLNGFRYNERNSLRYGSKLYFNCSDGYILEGPDVIQCVKTYGGGEDVSIANSSHVVMWNNDPPSCTRMGSTTSSTRSTVTIKGGALTNTITLNETPGSGKEKEHQFIIYIGIGIASGLLLLIVIIVLVVNMLKRRKRQQRSTASNLEPNEHDNYMPLNVRSGRGFADGRSSEDGQEVETDAYQALKAPPQKSSGTHPRIGTARSKDDDHENLSQYHEYDDVSSTRTPDGQQTKNKGGRDEHERIASHAINLYGNQQVIDLRQKREGLTKISTKTGESDYLEPIKNM